MNIVIIILGTLLVTFIIISPFFWLRFLYHKDRKLYVFYSTLATVGIFIINIVYIEWLITDYLSKVNAEIYNIYYSINDWTFYVFFFLTLLYPFFVAKIIYERITLKSSMISLGFSFIIVILHFLVFAFYIAPRAFESLNKNL